ncbi:two-component system, OmpR family, response regulator/two-component system, OmpR family, response regulator CpxR [Allopseudospirillum japonicum]|uniref:Two-component system, OmpR family, response regulator/two-component system, OmpR family, response regulator CpxR n=1 Tax=Allopseudospirillum japonicum TaxID=64971 RepID=A0A1H6R246_9GAMM|nr:response regulator transcription factor [Allopseudospirillum japonicum]SEI48496.1 two-component system, OmpR family, response regulator/two-component system, OmpR family, response regulator CpxR [Allopseudospirillum japonicum]
MYPQPLLLVDDDPELGELLREYLAYEGFELQQALDAEQAWQSLHPAQSHPYALVILDIMLPKQSGLDLLQQLRPSCNVPIIMLTGRGEDIDRILGLELGADDYLSKPCNPRELVARIRAVLRRTQANKPSLVKTGFPQAPLTYGYIHLHPGLREVKVHQQVIELTSAELNVLAYLMQAAGQVLSKEYLTERVLHRELTAYDRAIDVHISRVRQKLHQALATETEVIKTVRGQGYVWVYGLAS